MKVDSKHLMPFLDSLKGLLTDLQYGFRECEDVDQCENVLLYTQDHFNTIIVTFINDHLTPIIAPDSKLPNFIKIHDRLLQNPPKGREQTPSESKAVFKTQFYFHMKRKFEKNSVDHLPTNKLYDYILGVLAMNDPKYGSFFFTPLEGAATDVVVQLTDEIIEERRKHPQIELLLSVKEKGPDSKKLIDLL